MGIIEFLRLLPAPAWGLAGAIVGVLGTLGATAISNGSNNERFEKQLKHDAEQKSKDRAAVLRRDVYLKAVAELAEMNAFLGAMAGVDPTDSKAMRGSVLRFSKAFARAALVATESARQKVEELSGQYGKLFIELLGDAGPAHRLKIDMNINRGLYENLCGEQRRILAAMRDANESAESRYKFEALRRSADSVRDQIAEVSSQFSGLSNKHIEALSTYTKSTAEKMANLTDLQAEVAALFRGEFDLDVNVDAMKAQLAEHAKKAAAAGNEFISNVTKAGQEES